MLNNASYPIGRHAFWDHESLVECMFCVVWRPTGKSVLSRVTCEALPPLTPASFSSSPPLFFTSSHHLGSRKHRTISTLTDRYMTTPCQAGLCETLWPGAAPIQPARGNTPLPCLLHDLWLVVRLASQAYRISSRGTLGICYFVNKSWEVAWVPCSQY